MKLDSSLAAVLRGEKNLNEKKSMDNKPRERKNKHHTDPYTGIELGGMVSLFFLKAMYKSATFTASSFCTVGYTCVVEDGRRRLVYILKL